LVGFAIPEARRRQRDELRRRLVFLGGGSVYGGLYISPNPWEELVHSTAVALDVVEDLTLARTSTLTVGHIADPRHLADRVWSLSEVHAGYQRFAAALRLRLDALDDRSGDSSSVVRDALLTVAEFSRAITPDPLLPSELLPDDWLGRSARRLLLDAFSRFAAVVGEEQLPRGLRNLLGTSV
jgi:phenylacetic acid degradation operon negative regulatory protein